MLDPVDLFMEECSTLPGHVSRMLLLIRELDQQNFDKLSELDAKRHEFLQEVCKNSTGRKVCCQVPSMHASNQSLGSSPQSSQTVSFPFHEAAALRSIFDLGYSSKCLMQEKIAAENQLLHMVRHERDRLSRDHQKLVLESPSALQDSGGDGIHEDGVTGVVRAPNTSVCGSLRKSRSGGSGGVHHRSSGGSVVNLSRVQPGGSPVTVSPVWSDGMGSTVGSLVGSGIGSCVGDGGGSTGIRVCSGSGVGSGIGSVDGGSSSGLVIYSGSGVSPGNSVVSVGPIGGRGWSGSELSGGERVVKKMKRENSSLMGGSRGIVDGGTFSGSIQTNTGNMRISMASSKNEAEVRVEERPKTEEDTSMKTDTGKISWHTGSVAYTAINRMAELQMEDDTSDGICPICQAGESETQFMMVCCDACNSWFHFECVNYNYTAGAEDDAAWFCPQCIESGLVPQSAGNQDSKSIRAKRR